MSYLVGVDLGQASDFTAITVLEVVRREPDERERQVEAEGRALPALLTGRPIPRFRTSTAPHYRVRFMERPALGTPYPDVARRIGEIRRKLRREAPTVDVVVDGTGVGRPVVDMLHEAGLDPVAVTITGGDSVTRGDGGAFRVPKRDLVGGLQVLLQAGRLRVAKGLPLATTFLEELRAFRVKINPATAHDSYGAWREGEHDDLVLAVAVAAWWGEWMPAYDPADWPVWHG